MPARPDDHAFRYFDELIMPPNKTAYSTAPATVVDGEFRHNLGPPALPQHDRQPLIEAVEAAPSEQTTNGRKGPGSRAKSGQGKGGFTRPQETNVRDYQAAKKSGIASSGSRITSSTDRAVSECVDLKLTLRQRLDK